MPGSIEPYGAKFGIVFPTREDSYTSTPTGLSDRAIGRLRGLARREAKRDEYDWHLTVHLVSRTRGIGSTAALLVELDREMRRTVTLLDAVLRRQDLYYLPLPLRPERGGLRVVSAHAGSLHMDLELYGMLAQVASSSPIAIVSMFQTLWAIGQVSHHKLSRWSIATNRAECQGMGTPDEDASVTVERLTKAATKLAAEGFNSIDFEVRGSDYEVTFHAERG